MDSRADLKQSLIQVSSIAKDVVNKSGDDYLAELYEASIDIVLAFAMEGANKTKTPIDNMIVATLSSQKFLLVSLMTTALKAGSKEEIFRSEGISSAINAVSELADRIDDDDFDKKAVASSMFDMIIGVAQFGARQTSNIYDNVVVGIVSQSKGSIVDLIS